MIWLVVYLWATGCAMQLVEWDEDEEFEPIDVAIIAMWPVFAPFTLIGWWKENQ